MFALALLIGIYSYVIFILGLIGILTKESIVFSSILFIFLSIYYFHKKREDLPFINLRNKKVRPFFSLFLILAFINFIGALAPEYSFDALWYHLTLPKIFLQSGSINLPPNGIFYYSVMPKLGEMLFTPSVAFNLEVFAKLIQWVFGILTSIVIYKISRRSFNEKKSFLAVFIFYGSLMVAWQSTVAYVDLIRAFFEIMALWGFLVWREKKDIKVLIESGIFLGLAISTKLLALGSIPVFIILFLLFEHNKLKALKFSSIFMLTAILAALPWFLVAFMQTGSPIYPVLSDVYPKVPLGYFLSLSNALNDLFTLFFKADIPISPLYIIFLPLVFIFYKKLNNELRITSVYFLVSLVVWYFIPRTGGGRFILPYLPAASVLCIGLISQIKSEKIKKYSYALIIIVFVTTIFYRGAANVRYLPVVFGFESKNEFLTKKLNFNFGDFYDTDGFFKNNIKENDKVLLFGFHNLYYANFPFIHESYARPGDKFNFIAVQDTQLPIRYSNWNLIYENDLTNVKVYSLDGKLWHY